MSMRDQAKDDKDAANLEAANKQQEFDDAHDERMWEKNSNQELKDHDYGSVEGDKTADLFKEAHTGEGEGKTKVLELLRKAEEEYNTLELETEQAEDESRR